MSTIEPGQIVKIFTTKKGREAVIRYPKMEDLEQMTHFINTVSKEDTFITFSGEQQTQEQEKEFLEKVTKEMKEGDSVYLLCFVGDTLAGSSDITRNRVNRKRSRHVGTFGIVIGKEFRGEGIGSTLMSTILEESKKITGLKMLDLHVYGNNHLAQSIYKNFGFKEGGRIPGYYLHRGEYIDGIHMYKEV